MSDTYTFSESMINFHCIRHEEHSIWSTGTLKIEFGCNIFLEWPWCVKLTLMKLHVLYRLVAYMSVWFFASESLSLQCAGTLGRWLLPKKLNEAPDRWRRKFFKIYLVSWVTWFCSEIIRPNVPYRYVKSAPIPGASEQILLGGATQIVPPTAGYRWIFRAVDGLWETLFNRFLMM